MKKTLYVLTCALCALLVLPAAAQVPSYVPTDGLVGWWPFNGNANDESGNGNDGVVNGATLTEDRFGNAERAYDFNGSNQYIAVNSESTALLPTEQISISTWFKVDFEGGYSGNNTQGHIIRSRFYGYVVLYDSVSTSIIVITHHENSSEIIGSITQTPPSVNDNQWHLITSTFNGSISCLYMDGVLVDSFAASGNLYYVPDGIVAFGRDGNNPSPLTAHFAGSLDDIAIYNRALTEQEIQNLYTGTTPPPCVSLPSNLQQGLVGYWPFCGNANDESGNGNDGVVNGATLTEDRFGNAGSAYSFDGVDDYIELAYNSTLNLPLAITISAWFQADTLASMRIVDKSTVGGADGFLLDIGGNNNNKYIRAILAGQSDNQPTSSEFISETNTWYNIIVTYDGIAVRFYVNNELDTVLDISGESLLNSLPLRFGANSLLIDNFFNGLLDDIAIWNRALTPEEVQELYTGEPVAPPVSCTPLPVNLQQGLVGYWPFCGNANDESGNGNDGVVNGATLTEDRFGNANAAYGFDGVSNYIEIQDNDNLDLTNQFSISAWVEIPDYSLNPGYSQRTILGKPRPNGGTGFSLFALIGNDCSCPNILQYGAGWNNDIVNEFIASADTMPLASWTHIVFTNDGYTAKLFKNGVEVATTDFDLSLLNSDQSLYIGKEFDFSNSSDNRWYKGHLDDIGIWNRALTPEEVQELYTLDACTFTVYDTVMVENVINVYDTLTIENIVEVFDTTIVVETLYDTTYTNIEVFDTTTIVETEVVYDTITVENIVNVYDTSYITVTDTLLIDITFTGFEGQPSWLNTVIVYPNPANDHITIDYGNFALMAGYNTIITNAAGATVYSSAVNTQQVEIDINAWGSAGVYYMSIYDANGALAAVRHIVLE